MNNNLSKRVHLYKEQVINELGNRYHIPREVGLFIAGQYSDSIHWGEIWGWDARNTAARIFQKYKVSEMDLDFTE